MTKHSNKNNNLIRTTNKIKILWGFLILYFFISIYCLCVTQKSGVGNDNRDNFYSNVNMFSPLYQISNKIRAEYGHKLPYPSVDELLKFDGVVGRDGIHG